MAHGLYSSVPTVDGKWQVAVLSKNGLCCGFLPCVCDTKEEAQRFAEAYLRRSSK